jgi:hypothetical protein
MSNEKAYTPELGQAFYGCPTEANAMPRYAGALFSEVWRVMGREFGNTNQRTFNPRGEDDPKIPGFEVRPYWWGDDDAPQANMPNFVFGDVQIRWYKYPGRGMSTNVDWSPLQWVAWFDAAIKAIETHGKDRRKER